MSDLEDHAWVQAAKTGSSVAYSQLVNFHQAGLIAFLRRISVNSAEAEDIAQETFLFAWHELSRFDLDRSFRAWLFGIAWRKCRESRRSWLRRLRRETTAIEISLNPRASVLLCLMAGFSHEEAAQVMDATARKVKALVASARHKLSEMMGDRDDARC
jgi:DNA-directed RNA polymerase specialized sigma24 family protein